MSNLAWWSFTLIVITLDVWLLTQNSFFIANPSCSSVFTCCSNKPAIFCCTRRDTILCTWSTIVSCTSLCIYLVIIWFNYCVSTTIIINIWSHQFSSKEWCCFWKNFSWFIYRNNRWFTISKFNSFNSMRSMVYTIVHDCCICCSMLQWWNLTGWTTNTILHIEIIKIEIIS